MSGLARRTPATSPSSIMSTAGQCRLPLPFPEFRGKPVRLTDLMGTEVYDRDGSDMIDSGLYIDHAPWHFNVFELRAI
jgi:hypothetical protein